MKKALYSLIAAGMLATMILTGCQAKNNETPPPRTGSIGQYSVVTKQAPFTGVRGDCLYGGVTVDSGIDANGNGQLDASEVQDTQNICNGAPGADGASISGKTPLVLVTAEAAGSNCTKGGWAISVGPDSTTPTVITSVSYICHGVDGLNGTNVSCLSVNCHGNPKLVKTIQVAADTTESVPLYINQGLFATTLHGSLACVSCHTDIDPSGLHGPVNKTYGGWARFSKSQTVEAIAAGAELKTRNYYSTAVANSCATCHTSHSGFKNSAHATIFKLRGAHVDAELTAYATGLGDSGSLSNGFVGENYATGNCNRCHAACQSCHFKSAVTPKNADSVKNHWDEIQKTDKYTPISGGTPTSVPDSMSEYYMDWTVNIASHEFRNKAYFATDPEGVCEACHIGFNRPAKNAYYWKDAAKTIPGVVKAARVKRHPQAAELAISGSTVMSPLTGGTNTAHSSMTCADCHGTASGKAGNIHTLPGAEYEWSAEGDIQCTDCHGSVHSGDIAASHIAGSFGAHTKVACTGCHTFGLARDLELASSGTSSSHDAFLDPVTQEVRPVVWKNAEAIAWYSHNWQTLNPGTGRTDPAGDCAKKCHYEGNLVGAGY